MVFQVQKQPNRRKAHMCNLWMIIWYIFRRRTSQEAQKVSKSHYNGQQKNRSRQRTAAERHGRHTMDNTWPANNCNSHILDLGYGICDIEAGLRVLQRSSRPQTSELYIVCDFMQYDPRSGMEHSYMPQTPYVEVSWIGD